MSKDLGFEPDEEAIRAAVREYNSVGRSSAEAVFKQIVDAVKKEVVA
jgi:hypothetical protein